MLGPDNVEPFVQSCLAQEDDDEEAKNQKHTVMVFNEDVGAEGFAGLRSTPRSRDRGQRFRHRRRCLRICSYLRS